jgi:hypothetical protein
MSKIFIFLFLFFSINLFAYNDYDMDGVEDEQDKCPNTLLSELVNQEGCAIKNLQSYHHFNIFYGLNFYQTNYATLEESNTFSNSLQLDYYYKKISLSMFTSYYNSSSSSYNEEGLEDSSIDISYNFNSIKNLDFSLGLGVILPTYDTELHNNNTDIYTSITFNYHINTFYLLGGYTYTIINDDDVPSEEILYQNTSSYNIGVGFYLNNKLYLSSSYSSGDSIYQEVDNINVVSIYGNYTIDEHWSTNITYAYGLSESASDNFISLKIGYYF